MKKFVPHTVVFITSMGVMIIELLASRLVSKYFGNSLYTWTGVIGVVLAGISLGNYLGGRLADRYRPRDLIAPLLLAASGLVFLILAMDGLLYVMMSRGEVPSVTLALVVRAVVIISLLFFLPATSLGTISPVMAKFALEENTRIGKTVGSIYAVSAIGSIVGTFLSGFVLIPLLGITTVVLLVGLMIAVLALLMGGYRVISAPWAGIVLVAFLLQASGLASALLPSRVQGYTLLESTDSMYSHIEVRDVPQSGYTERVLILDGLIHNRYDPADPDDLLYDYEKIFAALTAHFTSEEAQLRTLTLGGGACIFPFYLERHYPESRNRIVEIDPEVLRVARQYFDVPDSDRTLTSVLDARQFVAQVQGAERYDLIFLDAFSSFSVPYHLTTREFTEMIAEILEPDGLFVINIIDVFDIGRFLNAYINTVRTVFPHVRLYRDPVFSGNRRATFVLVAFGDAASRNPEGDAAFRGGEAAPEVLYHPDGRPAAIAVPEADLQDLRSRNGNRVLTDNHAPVENLIAPVFLDSVN